MIATAIATTTTITAPAPMRSIIAQRFANDRARPELVAVDHLCGDQLQQSGVGVAVTSPPRPSNRRRGEFA